LGLLIFKFFILIVILVDLIEGVTCISKDHVDEFLKQCSVAILFKIFSENFVSPQSSKNFVCVVTILEFLIKLIGSPRVGNTTVEIDKTYSKILSDYIAFFELLMYYTSFRIM